jgi:hypothetical protein
LCFPWQEFRFRRRSAIAVFRWLFVLRGLCLLGSRFAWPAWFRLAVGFRFVTLVGFYRLVWLTGIRRTFGVSPRTRWAGFLLRCRLLL